MLWGPFFLKSLMIDSFRRNTHVEGLGPKFTLIFILPIANLIALKLHKMFCYSSCAAMSNTL